MRLVVASSYAAYRKNRYFTYDTTPIMLCNIYDKPIYSVLLYPLLNIQYLLVRIYLIKIFSYACYLLCNRSCEPEPARELGLPVTRRYVPVPCTPKPENICTRVPEYSCTLVTLHPFTCEPVNPCTLAPLYPCTLVPMYPRTQ